MENEKIALSRSLEESLKKQDDYAKSRHVRHWSMQITNLIPTVVINSLNSSLMNCNWSEEERAQITKIVTVLDRHPRTRTAAKDLIVAIDTLKEQAKFVSTYIRAEPDDDGRWRCSWKQTGVSSAPGRLSSAQTNWSTGLNFQNIPENAKDMFVAPPGWEFSYYDMAQIEARIVAFLAHIPVWKLQFENARLHPGSYDAHCALAAEMYRVPYDDVPRQDRDASANLPSGMFQSGVATASTTGWQPTSSPPSQDCHTLKLSRLIASTTWQRHRSNCGGMTLLTSCDGKGLSLLVLEDDGSY